MTDDATQPDNAGNRPQTAQDDAIDRLGLVFPDMPIDAVARGVAAVAEALGKPGATTALVIRLADCEAQLDAARQQRDDARERIGAVERNAELLVVARHDLMVEVDEQGSTLRSYVEQYNTSGDRARLIGVPAAVAEQAAQLLDRLAAYMKGQDDRLVALGDRLATATTERNDLGRTCQHVENRLAAILLPVPDNWAETGHPTIDAQAADLIGIGVSFMENLASALQGAAFKGWHPADDPAEFVIDAVNRVEEAEQLVEDARPSVRLVNDWATWSDASLYAYADAILRKVLPNAPARDAIVDALAEIRKVARDRLGDDGFTIPPGYTEADVKRAQRALDGSPALTVEHVGGRYRAVLLASGIDTIAQALGMRRAGA